MLCQNCEKQEANIKYTQTINGVKKEIILCDKCAKELGITENISFHMPMDLPSFLGDFLSEYNTNFISDFKTITQLKCNNCGTTYDEFVTTGKFGCGTCYEIFSDRIDPILKSLQTSNRHNGRKATTITQKANTKIQNENKNPQKETEETNKTNKTEKLKNELKNAIKEEKYEEAAKIRDELKKIE